MMKRRKERWKQSLIIQILLMGVSVGVIYADGANVNLELIKRGAAAYLPYRSKQGRPISTILQEFAAAQETVQI